VGDSRSKARAIPAPLLAHPLIESPQQIYGTWANDLSMPALLCSVDSEHMHNLFGVESPLLGVLATLLATVLTALLLVAWAVAIRDAQRRDDLEEAR
jgi:hypothetical protein